MRLFESLRFLACLMASAWAICRVAPAHEGHAPLPSKGVEVDTEKGLLTLSVEAQKSLGVQLASVDVQALEDKTLAYASLVVPWQSQYFVSSRLAGRIGELHVRTGDRVRRGQLLAEINSPELEVVQLEFRNALNNLALSARQLERSQALAKSGALAGRELIDANATHQQNLNAAQIARSKLKSLGLDEATIERIGNGEANQTLVTLPIISPLDGTVNHSDLAVGKVVGANEHLFEVSNLSRLWARFGVLERDVGRVKLGQRVELELTAYPGQSFSTVVSATSFYVDPITHLATVWADISNIEGKEPRFLPGMHGLARIVTSEPAKLPTIPSSSLLGTGAERFVLVEVAATNKGHEYRRQNVVVAAQNSAYTQIRSGGLYPGDRIVTSGAHILSSFFILGSLRLSPEGLKNIALQVEPVQRRNVEQVLEFDGRIDLPPENRATISSQLPGAIFRVLVDRGQAVKAGEILAEVASLQIQETQLSLIRAHLEAELLEGTMKRLQGLDDSQILARKRIWETENLLNAAINQRESARRTLLNMGLTQSEISGILDTRQPLAALPLRSPIAGTVVRFDKVLGEEIKSEEPVFEIHDLSHPLVQGFLTEREAAVIHIGMPVRIRLSADEHFMAEGWIIRSARVLRDENRTLAVWVEFDTPTKSRLQQNLLARISATVEKGTLQLAIPRSAFVKEGTRSYVFVEKQNALLDRRYVEVGRADDRYIQVLKGLSEGERVAVQGAAELQTTYASIR